MGPAEVDKPRPDKFLKKHEKEPLLPDSKQQTKLNLKLSRVVENY